MNTPRVAVLVPTIRPPEESRGSLLQLVKQDYPLLHLFLGEDGTLSTEKKMLLADLINSREGRKAGTFNLFQFDSGPHRDTGSFVRNEMMFQVSMFKPQIDYVAFADDDDGYAPSWISEMVAKAVEEDFDLVVSRMLLNGEAVPRNLDTIPTRCDFGTPNGLFRWPLIQKHQIMFGGGDTPDYHFARKFCDLNQPKIGIVDKVLVKVRELWT